MGRVLLEYGTPMTSVSLFRYLGQTFPSTNNDCLAVERNLRRVQGKWGWLAKILGREAEDKRTTGRFYVTVVQAVLLFGSETWVLTPRLEKSLEGFHHGKARWMADMCLKQQRYRTWVYPLIGAELLMVGLEEIKVYITSFQNTVAQYIATRPIMELCLATERKPVMSLYRKWWEQISLDILGIRVRE